MREVPTGEQPVAGYREALSRCLQRFGVEATSRFVPISRIDGQAHVLTKGGGPPVVMIAAPGPAALWAPLMACLDGFSLYAVDGPGFGLTDPVSYGTDELRDLAVDFLDELLGELGLTQTQTAFVASSIGGLWATWLALDRPHRVSALALVGAPSMLLNTNPPLQERLLSVPSLGRLMMRLRPPSPKQVDQLFGMMNEDVSDLPEVRDLMLASERLSTFVPSFLGFLHATVDWRGSRPNVRLTADQLEQLTQRVQLIWGENEPAGSRQVAHQAVSAIRHSELHFLPTGHIPWLSRPGGVAALLDPFLNDYGQEASPDGETPLLDA